MPGAVLSSLQEEFTRSSLSGALWARHSLYRFLDDPEVQRGQAACLGCAHSVGSGALTLAASWESLSSDLLNYTTCIFNKRNTDEAL